MKLDEAFDLCDLRALVRMQLKRAYSEPHRKYHNLEHLENMLRWVPSLAGREGFVDYEMPVLINSILFHDLVFLPQPVAPGYNEQLSAVEYVLQEYWLKTPFEQGQLYPRVAGSLFEAYVIEAINASAHHTVSQRHLRPTSEWFLDLDLQSLGQSFQEFEHDCDRSLDELALIHRDASTADIKQVQTEFYERLLLRPKIYYRMTEWEQNARANIRRRLGEKISQDHSSLESRVSARMSRSCIL